MLATERDSHQTLRARVAAKRSLDMAEPKRLSPKGIRHYLLNCYMVKVQECSTRPTPSISDERNGTLIIVAESFGPIRDAILVDRFLC